MKKTILLTGATDGIGLETAKKFLSLGHLVLLHGRNPEKLAKVEKELSALGMVESYVADLSNLSNIESLVLAIRDKHKHIDVLINNAGVYKTSESITSDGLDVRFVVNTIAPYLLTKKLLPLLGAGSRIINLSSAAQATVEIDALLGLSKLDDYGAYAQSKLAIIMWSRHMAEVFDSKSPIIIAVNPGSLLASKMVREGFGQEGRDINIGVDILVSLSLDEKHLKCSGLYYDNDAGKYNSPHVDGFDKKRIDEVVSTIEKILS